MNGLSAEVVFEQGGDICWPNDPNLSEVNNDDIDDWVAGTGFLPLPGSYSGRLGHRPAADGVSAHVLHLRHAPCRRLSLAIIAGSLRADKLKTSAA